MKWRLIVLTGSATGAALWAVRRKQQRQTAADAELWAAATDPVDRFGS